ncbi:Fic family protein [Marinobacterium halophilum]|uniref:Fic family protein n=1 Tax=Marinobacterium halophilum TaxID=267374 RepID=A0A2P8EIE9_9GAMM|nr:Fic family protein [Marinobacterium halophilum]PSL09201.1 Fic family protein [Marinobacterium halophilum]
MKIPEPPPPFGQILNQLMASEDTEHMVRVLGSNVGPVDSKGRYLHWEKLKYIVPPEGFSPEEYWLATKKARESISKELPFQDKNRNTFSFCVPDILHKELHWLDQNAAGSITMDRPITNPHTRDTYLVSSLFEESISSSQLEGASTTREVAKEMLRQGRTPKDHSEKMIYNNYNAMNFIREFKDEDLTPSFILELHALLTKDTLDDPKKCGKLRSIDDDIHVVDSSESTILHTPPNANTLEERLKRLCAFANNATQEFIHPVIKAITLHFMIGYDHPFVDGNGRTARALFYWAMAKQGYWLMEFISISTIIKKNPVQYAKAYLHTETDSNDLTYFLIHQIEIINKAVVALHQYLERKAVELNEAEDLLEKSQARGQLNHRQLSLLKHALDNPGAIYRIQDHKTSHRISYQTARTDLLKMSDELNLLRKRKYGNAFVFIAPQNLRERLSDHGI